MGHYDEGRRHLVIIIHLYMVHILSVVFALDRCGSIFLHTYFLMSANVFFRQRATQTANLLFKIKSTFSAPELVAACSNP